MTIRPILHRFCIECRVAGFFPVTFGRHRMEELIIMGNNKTSRLASVSVRTYLLAGISVLGAGAIAGVPDTSQPAAPEVPSLVAAASDRGPAPAPSSATSPLVIAPLAATPAATEPAAVQSALVAPAPGLQLSLLTGSPNLGAGNIGSFNTGIDNQGIANTGANNDGNFNIGAANDGDFNIGVNNVGDFNIGIGNEGDYNVGIANNGERNFGAGNSGALNVGFANTGTANFGIGNNGTGNVGFFNTGDYTIGAFNIGLRYADGGPTAAAEDTVSRLSADNADGSASTRATTGSTPRVSTKDGNKVQPGTTSASSIRDADTGDAGVSTTVGIAGPDSRAEVEDDDAAVDGGTDANDGGGADSDSE